MIYLELFLVFLEIGAVSFGGGYGMISLIKERIISKGWLEEDVLLNMIAVSESTPGPLAVNMATFIGSSKGGMLGALVATLGVILPSFIIILIIAALITNLLKYKGVQAFLGGVRPCIIGLIIATSLIMGFSMIFNLKNINSEIIFNVKGIIILFLILAIDLVVTKGFKKKLSPLLLIFISASLGMVLYGIF